MFDGNISSLLAAPARIWIGVATAFGWMENSSLC